mmetsp:Transcript_28784/g.54668  ORF Transcript_28784/g.54668 Transcript_28784/m.54668 type:complete len:326 (+) Transcript_28784:3767-4744(+)
MFGIVKEGVGRGLFHQPPQIKHADLVGHVLHHRQVMADKEVGEAKFVLEIAHQVQHLGLHRHIERTGRFIADDQLGFGGKRAGDANPLALTTGEFMRKFACITGRQAYLFQQFLGEARHLSAPCGDGFGDDVPHPPTRVERGERVLKNHLNIGAHIVDLLRVGLAGQINAANFHGPCGGPEQPHKHLADGGFARAAFADKGIDGAFFDVETHVGHSCQQRLGFAFDQPVEPGLGDVKNAGEVANGNEAHQATSLRARGKKQAARPPPSSIRGPGSWRHWSCALGQRGLNAQPLGRASRRGIAPGIWCRRSLPLDASGVEPMSPSV